MKKSKIFIKNLLFFYINVLYKYMTPCDTSEHSDFPLKCTRLHCSNLKIGKLPIIYHYKLNGHTARRIIVKTKAYQLI